MFFYVVSFFVFCYFFIENNDLVILLLRIVSYWIGKHGTEYAFNVTQIISTLLADSAAPNHVR